MSVTRTQIGIFHSVDYFVYSLIKAFSSIIHVEFSSHKVKIYESSRFHTQYPCIICVPFSGSVIGEFFICVNQEDWLPQLAKVSGVHVDDANIDALVDSTLQEIINTAAGGAMSEIKATFGAVTMASPRMIKGELIYPETRIFNIDLCDHQGKVQVEARLSFDLMEQELNTIHEKLKRDSKLDETGLFNKKFFQEIMETIEKRYEESGFFSIIFCDINRLKYVNDNFGHGAGDAYIHRACSIVKTSCRLSDYCFRIGGDELVLLLPKCTLEEARYVTDRIEKAAEKTQIELKKEDGTSEKMQVHISIGAASNSENIDPKDVINFADQRMEAKKKTWYHQQDFLRRKN